MKYNLNVSSKRRKVRALAGADPIAQWTVLDEKIIDHVSGLKYLSCEISHMRIKNVEEKLNSSLCSWLLRGLY
jgi:hypothetical protein